MPDGSFTPNPKPEIAEATAPAPKDPRDVSTVAFPYHTLEDAVGIARAILDKGGVPLARDQLAAATGLKLGSGNFTNKISAARLFGLIEGTAGKSQLTRLGFDILDKSEARARAAKVKAFLNVPLYRRAYEEFRNGLLPPRPHGLESAFVSFGVTPKQKDRARRVFDNSARIAGFFDHGDDRLVEPVIGQIQRTAEVIRHNHGPYSDEKTPGPSQPPHPPSNELGPGPGPASSASEHPFIKGLLLSLPKLGDEWTAPDRVKWLQAAAASFDLMYKGDGQIRIELARNRVGWNR